MNLQAVEQQYNQLQQENQGAMQQAIQNDVASMQQNKSSLTAWLSANTTDRPAARLPATTGGWFPEQS